ncbi:MAG: DNA cytosine methyltransferase [Desulforhopalus sp.]|nr:DNA cytosine methyltransferase [Desulforhopalus sp.]
MTYQSVKNTSVEFFLRQEQRVYESRISGHVEPQTFDLIDSFAGAGGMTLGFSKRFGHSFRSVWANDSNEYCGQTYNANFGEHCRIGDIVSILEDPSIVIPTADVVIGGPPCQGFSLLNKNRTNDPRKQLWRPYFEIVRRSEAKIFVMENVPQLLKSAEYEDIVRTAKGLGFKVWSGILCAADYGVSQTRRRAFIIGCKTTDPLCILPPRKTHFKPKTGKKESFLPFDKTEYIGIPKEWRTVRNAIEDLLPPVGTSIREEAPPYDLHFGRNPTELSKKRYRIVSEEGMNRFDLQRLAPELTPPCWLRKKSGSTDLFGRLWWNRPAFTIRTEFYKPEKGRYLHPQQHRPLTHREAARLQSFPDDFIFKGSKIEIAKQIGNAVPPLLAARIADVVHLLLTVSEEGKG